MYKTERMELRLTPHELRMLDQVRGSATRSAWIRNTIIRAAHAQEPPTDAHDPEYTPS